MIPALRLTIMLVCAPVTLAAQVPPTPPEPPTPRVAPERAPTPRPERAPRPPREPRPLRDWALTPMPDLWHEPTFELRDFHLELPEMRFERFETPMPHFEMPDMSFHTPKFEAKMEQLDAKRFELDARMEEMSFRSIDRWTPRADSPRGEPFATKPRAPWLQGDPADSIYKSAYELLNRGEWRRAASGFAAIPQRYPNSGYASDALYWHAFALYRIGSTEDLKTALRSLETMRSKYPQAKTQADAAALTTRIQGALASRGDQGAERAIREASEQGQPTCDREDMAVRAEAMKSLAQTDPAAIGPIVRRVLARKDACSAPLRRQAIHILGQNNDPDAATTLREVALNDQESEVRSTAIQYLGRSSSDVAVTTLDEILRTATDQGLQRAAARALASSPSPRAKQAVRALIERADAPERLRIEAVGAFENSERATDEDATYLRNIYNKVDNPRVKARIARVLGHLGGETNDAWLLTVMRNNDEPLEVRTAALSRVASRNMAIADAVRLYGNVADREMRQQLINIYGQRREPEATDKLIDIAKNDTDYNLRRQAINALTRKNDPRATKLLLEIIDK